VSASAAEAATGSSIEAAIRPAKARREIWDIDRNSVEVRAIESNGGRSVSAGSPLQSQKSIFISMT
jgi:hypothetical protein